MTHGKVQMLPIETRAFRLNMGRKAPFGRCRDRCHVFMLGSGARVVMIYGAIKIHRWTIPQERPNAVDHRNQNCCSPGFPRRQVAILAASAKAKVGQKPLITRSVRWVRNSK